MSSKRLKGSITLEYSRESISSQNDNLFRLLTVKINNNCLCTVTYRFINNYSI